MRNAPWIALLLTSCVSSTGGQRVVLRGEVGSTVSEDGPLTYLDDGWAVTLEQATLYAGPFYLWSDEPLLDIGRLWALGGATAHAQDQFEAGFITGEFPEQVRVDLLSTTPAPLALGDAIAGPSGSVEVWLEPGPGREPTLRVLGEARRGSDRVPFRAELTLDEAWFDVSGGENPLIQRRVRGLPWDAALADGGTARFLVDPTRLLVGMDFDALATQPTEDGRHPVRPGTQPGNVLRDRVRQTGSRSPWTVRWDAP